MGDALILLSMDKRGFDIIITEQRLLGMYEFELLRIGKEMDLPVIGTYTQLVQFLKYAIFFLPHTKKICHLEYSHQNF